jgi:alkylation response protein AidB-like acyl-CoA dehydrogenase
MPLDIASVMHEVGPEFAARAARHDEQDLFVADNFAILKERGILRAAVPGELGGGGAEHRDLAETLRALARYCGSTALALSMHTHQVTTLVWRWRRDPRGPVEMLLRDVAAENLVLVSSGGSDWIAGSGKAERVDGGWRITARKVFASGVPIGDVLVTSAIWDDPADGPVVLHFPLSLRTAGVSVLDTWRVLGMRGTGSHDIAINGAVVPEAAIIARRPPGRWHLVFHVISLLAIPLIYSVYLGVAEAARDIALDRARGRRDGQDVSYVVGEMENELATARFAHRDMLEAAATVEPGRAGDEPCDDGPRCVSACGYPRGRKGDGRRRRRRVLSRFRPRVPFPRRAGCTLSSAAGNGAVALCGSDGARLGHQRLRCRERMLRVSACNRGQCVMSVRGTSRQFAATQHFGCFQSEADID